MLVGMLKNSSYFNPLRRAKEVKQRRNVVLKQMNRNAFISLKEKDSLQQLELGLDVHKEGHSDGYATYFRSHLQKVMRKWVQKNPKQNGIICYGEDLRTFDTSLFFADPKLNFDWLITAFSSSKNEPYFFLKNGFFNLLTGTYSIRQMIEQGRSESELRLSYRDELKEFNEIRNKYLIYEDFK